MKRRLLAQGERLWAQGDPASSMGVVEKGKVAVRTEGRLLGVLFPNMVLGESAILSLGGPPSRRTASVVALEDGTVVTEYPASMVQESFGVGVPRKVLRTLCGQICRNALLAIATNPDQPAVGSSLLGLIQGIVECERQTRKVSDWDSFLVSFRLLYHLRDGSDAMRNDLVGDRGRASETVEAASRTMREIFKTPDVHEYLEQFLEAEKQRGGYSTSASG